MNIGSMNIESIIIFLAVGILVGWLAGKLTKGSGFGIIGNLIVGIAGALVGGFVFGLLGINAAGLLGQIVLSTVGAMLFLFMTRFIKGA